MSHCSVHDARAEGGLVIYRLLGELEIGEAGQPLELPGGHTLIVLAALLINANQRISKAELLQAAWGSGEVSEAQLHKAIATIRALLTKIGKGEQLRTYSRQGYEIRATNDDLDMLAFRRLAQQAGEARAAGLIEDEIGHLTRALELWRGQHPLSNVPSNAFRQEAEQLEQRRKRAAARLYDLELSRRNYDRVLDDLALIADYYPADERLCQQLMVVQYRCDHVADAVAAYERYADELAKQTGGPPDPALRDLYYAVANRDEATIRATEAAIARRAAAASAGATGPGAAVPRQLPDPPDLVGREQLVAEVAWLLGRSRGNAAQIVVISGSGGIGKTALALRAGHQVSERYPDGQLFAELRGTTGGPLDPSEVLAQFLRAFGVSAIPEGRAERASAYRTQLAGRRVLVVLDDAADGAQIRDLIPGNPACAVLATARQRIPEISGAHHVPPLAPLPRADAAELFHRVARNSAIDLQAETAAVERVVALCGGLPLALHIAAALRVHYHPRPTSELADRLAQQGSASFIYKELSLARTIGAGFDRLDDEGRQLFLELGLLRLPSFGLWTAAALGGQPDSDATAALSQLAASNMIDPIEPEVRYRFHDLTRDYAAHRARTVYSGDDRQTTVVTRACQALLTLTRRAHAQLYGGDFEVVHSSVADWNAPPSTVAEVEEAPLEWFEKERLNIRAAVNHCADLGLTEICWDLAVSAHEFYTVRGYFDDWCATHTVALQACRRAGDRRGEGVVLACLGQPTLAASRRDCVPGLTDLQKAVDLLAECGDRHGQAIALRTLANGLRRRGHLTAPLAMFREALGYYKDSGDIVGAMQALRFIGQTYLVLGNGQDALAALQAAEEMANDLGRQRLIAQTRYWTGQAYLAIGGLDGAQAAFDAVYEAFPDNTSVGHAYAMHGLGDLEWRAGAYETAGQYLDQAADLAREEADAFLEGRVWLSVAAMREAEGQPVMNINALERAVALFAECGVDYLEVRALAGLAQAMTGQGDTGAAEKAWARVETLYESAGVPPED